MYYLCLECKNIFYGDNLNPLLKMCPLATCNGNNEFFEIDELMIEPIQLLNDKGWYTQYCCSGHSFKDYISGYISFYNDAIPDFSCPEGWYWDNNCLRMNVIQNLSSIEKRESISQKMLTLLKWCNELPINDEGEGC